MGVQSSPTHCTKIAHDSPKLVAIFEFLRHLGRRHKQQTERVVLSAVYCTYGIDPVPPST